MVGPFCFSWEGPCHLHAPTTFAGTTRALHWARGRPARHEHRRCEDLVKGLMSNVLFALRAHGGRAARGPSQTLECSSEGSYQRAALGIRKLPGGLPLDELKDLFVPADSNNDIIS